MKLKSFLVVSTQADSAKKVAPVAASAIMTICPPAGMASVLASIGPSV